MTGRNKIYSLLRWSEKWTKTDMVYLAKGGFWLTLGQMIAILSSLILAIAFANLLPKEAYGNYKYILAIYSLLTLTTLPGINTALIRSVAKGFEGSLNQLTKVKIKWGFIGTLFSLILAYYYHNQGNATLTSSFIALALFIPFIESFNLYSAFLVGKKSFKKSVMYGTITKLVSTTAIVLTIILTQNILAIILAYFLSYTLLRLLFSVITIKKIKLNSQIDDEAEGYGKKLSLINIVSAVEKNLDKILVFSQIGPIEMALYSFATLPIEQIKNVLINIRYLALPKLSEKPIQEIKKSLNVKIIKMLIVVTATIVIYIAAAPYIYKLLFPNYIETVFYSQIFALSLLASPVFITIPVLESQQAVGLISKFKITSAIIQITLLIIMFYYWGILGVIISRVIARIATFLLSMHMIKKMN